jgi:hypothetical protein
MTKTSKRTIALRPAITAILAASFAPAAQAQETWVAVATDDGPNFGYAVGMATREAAEMTSLGECVGSCRIRLTAPARCVAFVRSDPGNALGLRRRSDARDGAADGVGRLQSPRPLQFLHGPCRAVLRVKHGNSRAC